MTKHIILALVATLTIAACTKGSPVATRPNGQLVAVPAVKASGFKLDLGTCTDTAAVIAAEQRADRVEVEWVLADSAAAQAVAPKLALALPAKLALATDTCSL